MTSGGDHPHVRGHDPAQSLAALASVEPDALELARGEQAAATFHVVGKWCLSARFLKRLYGGSGREAAWQELRAISNLTPLGLTARLARKRTLQARSKAAAVVLRNNVRAIYPDRGVTLKLSNPIRPDARIAIGREADVRRRLRSTSLVLLPPMHRAASGGEGTYIVEELIVGADRYGGRIDLAGWAAPLFEFYRLNGLAAKPLSDLIDLESGLERFEQGCRTLSVKVPRALMTYYFGDLIRQFASGGMAIESFTHGDLAPSNLLFKESRIFLLDWEYGRPDALLSDIARLAGESPQFCDRFLAELKAWAASRGIRMVEPSAQLLLGCLVAVLRRLERYEGFLRTEGGARLKEKYQRKVGAIVDLAVRRLPRT